MRICSFCFAVLIGITTCTPILLGQVPDSQRQRRRDFLDNLLNRLIESQLDQTQPRITDPNLPTSPKMQQARTQLQQFSGGVGRLIGDLRREEARSARFRPQLADAIRVKATSDGLYQTATRTADINVVKRGFTSIDRDWRSLAHKLSQSRGLSSQCVNTVNEVNRIENRLCLTLGLEPQLDRAELIRLVSNLNASFQHLLQDIYYDLQGHPQQTLLIRDGRALMIKLRQSTSLIDRGNLAAIVQAYKGFQSDWRNFSGRLRTIGNERIRRDLQKMERISRRINAALWLPTEIDRQYLAQLLDSILHDVQHIAADISLRDLLASPRPRRLLSAAREFQNNCEGFSRTITGSDNLDELIWDYRVFEVSWQDLFVELQSLNSPTIASRLEPIRDSIELLDQALGESPQISHGELMRMAAQLDELARQCEQFIVQKIVPSPNYDRTFKLDLQQQTNQFHVTAHSLHQNLGRRINEDVVRQDLQNVVTHWSRIKPLVQRCGEQERKAFAPIRAETEPLVVKLQVVFTDAG